LGKTFVGREFDKQFAEDLLTGVDPCGENGEFHFFAYDGPNFKTPVTFTKGEVTMVDNRFWHCDFVPC
jgi:diphthamide synthase (EF-2-diphthine--ammonia ligase)